MRARVWALGAVLAVGFAFAGPANVAAQCVQCDPFGFIWCPSRDIGFNDCGEIPICDPGGTDCVMVCIGENGTCGIAVAPSGQVVLSPAEAEAVDVAVGEDGILRRMCDGAMVVVQSSDVVASKRTVQFESRRSKLVLTQ